LHKAAIRITAVFLIAALLSQQIFKLTPIFANDADTGEQEQEALMFDVDGIIKYDGEPIYEDMILPEYAELTALYEFKAFYGDLFDNVSVILPELLLAAHFGEIDVTVRDEFDNHASAGRLLIEEDGGIRFSLDLTYGYDFFSPDFPGPGDLHPDIDFELEPDDIEDEEEPEEPDDIDDEDEGEEPGDIDNDSDGEEPEVPENIDTGEEEPAEPGDENEKDEKETEELDETTEPGGIEPGEESELFGGLSEISGNDETERLVLGASMVFDDDELDLLIYDEIDSWEVPYYIISFEIPVIFDLDLIPEQEAPGEPRRVTLLSGGQPVTVSLIAAEGLAIAASLGFLPPWYADISNNNRRPFIGSVHDYGFFVFGNLSVTTTGWGMMHSESGVAIRDNLILTSAYVDFGGAHYSVGVQRPPHNPRMLVGRDVTGTVPAGSPAAIILHGGDILVHEDAVINLNASIEPDNIIHTSANNWGTVPRVSRAEIVTFFNQAHAELNSLSRHYSLRINEPGIFRGGIAPAGRLIELPPDPNQYDILIYDVVVENGVIQLPILNFDGFDEDRLYVLNVGNYGTVRFSGDTSVSPSLGTGVDGLYETAREYSHRIIWNFVGTGDIITDWQTIMGSVIAPNAHFRATGGGSVNGYLITGHFTHSGQGFEVHTTVKDPNPERPNRPLRPLPPPEPPTGPEEPNIDRPPISPPPVPPIDPPTVPPIVPPIDPPTVPPIVPPIDPPTVPPIDPPTVPPIDPPTVPPTDPPTVPPVEPPTAPPVEPPTAPPVEPPTVPPVNPPTVPPEGPDNPEVPLIPPLPPGELPPGFEAVRVQEDYSESDDLIYIIHDDAGVPLGMVRVPSGMTLSDIHIFDNKIPLARLNPQTSDSSSGLGLIPLNMYVFVFVPAVMMFRMILRRRNIF